MCCRLLHICIPVLHCVVISTRPRTDVSTFKMDNDTTCLQSKRKKPWLRPNSRDSLLQRRIERPSRNLETCARATPLGRTEAAWRSGRSSGLYCTVCAKRANDPGQLREGCILMKPSATRPDLPTYTRCCVQTHTHTHKHGAIVLTLRRRRRASCVSPPSCFELILSHRPV